MHAYCGGGRLMPRPARGYWVDRSDIMFVPYVFKCLRASCTGAADDRRFDDDDNDVADSQEEEDRRLSEEEDRRLSQEAPESCWSIDAYSANASSSSSASISSSSQTAVVVNGDPCDSDTLMCIEGSTGPLCGSCLDGYTFNSALSLCVACESASNTTPLMLMGAFAAVAVIALVLQLRGFDFGACLAYFRLGILRHIDEGTVKVLWTTTQIVSSVQWNLNVEFPSPFSKLLEILSFLQLDFLTLDCVSGKNSYFAKVYVTQFFPIFLALVIALLGALRVLVHKCCTMRSTRMSHRSINSIADDDDEKAVERRHSLAVAAAADPNDAAAAADDDGDAGTSNSGNTSTSEADARQRIVNQTIYAELLLSYVVLPNVSSLQFKALLCEELELPNGGGATFLKEDSNIDCRSDEYLQFKAVVILGIFVYQSIPLVWFVCLWRVRHELNPPGAANARAAAEQRQEQPHLAPYRFLFSCCKLGMEECC
jgi:hypothetical protein